MTALTHEQCQWLNLLMIFVFIFGTFAAGGYIIDRQEEKREKQQAKKSHRRRKHTYQRQCEDINVIYSALGKYYIGMNHFNAICHDCQYQKDNKCFCTDKPKLFRDDTGAMADCSCYQKKECEKGQKNNYSEQHSE